MIVLLIGMSSPLTGHCTTSITIQLTRSFEKSGGDDPDLPSLPHKTPPSRTVTCYIDSQFRLITFSPDISDLIFSYEIWTASQSICIGSYTDPEDFLAELSQWSTTVTIVLELDGGTCIGTYTP